MPSIPDPCAEAAKRDAVERQRRCDGRRKLDVVPQVGHVPIERRIIGDDAQRIVVHMQLAADVLNTIASTRRVDHDVMRAGAEAPLLEHDFGHDDLRHGRLHFVDGREVLQNP